MTKAEFELAIERHIAAPPEVVFRVWTTRIIEHDMRPGGRSALEMRGPDGASSPMEGVFLEVVPNRRIVFTNAFTAGWMPQKPFMVGVFDFTPQAGGTRYRAASRHWDAETHQQHEAMGFQRGWGAVADQLAALAEAEAKAG